MARLSVIERNDKRRRKSQAARAKRKKLKEQIRKGDENDQETAIVKLQRCSRDENPVRHRSRCRFCGRSYGTLKKFGLCRIHLREAAMRGDVPGLRKASW